MSDKPIGSFSLTNELELAWRYIKSELEDADIEVQQTSPDDTITTDREVPDEIRSRLIEFARDKGITLRFKVSGQED